MELPCRVRVNYRSYAVAVHRRLCYPHVTSAAVVYGGWGYWTVTNGQRICLTRSRKTLRLSAREATITGLESIKKEGGGYRVALYQRATREIQNSLSLYRYTDYEEFPSQVQPRNSP